MTSRCFRITLAAGALWLMLAAPSWAESNLWINVGDELLDLAAAPVTGTWEGYALAAGFAGGVVVGLRHDMEWFNAVQTGRNYWQDKFIPPLSLLGDGWIHIGGYAALYQWGDEYDRRVAAQALEGQVCVALSSLLLKVAFTAQRPASPYNERLWFTGNLSDKSFPSGHSMTAFCAAAILGDAYHMEWLAYPLAAGVAYSRVYHRRHAPVDVIAGAGLGLLIGHTVLAFHRQADLAPGVHFSTWPDSDGGRIMVSWDF